MVAIPPGTYADGMFVNTTEGTRWHVLKYDINGNVQEAIYLDIVQEINVNLAITFYRNPYNGHFYILGDRQTNQEATMAGEPIGPGFFMASFDEQGNYLWRRQALATGPLFIRPYNLLFDSASNIYFGGVISGLNTVSFLGYSVPLTVSPAFLMKLNPLADTIEYVSNSNRNGALYGGIVFKDDEIGMSSWGGGPNFTWGSQSIFISNAGEGTKPLLATFNKDTGACTNLTFIPASVGSQNIGASIAVDSSGDYIIGGSFDGTQTYANNTITSIGGQSDFFVAKYATSTCSLDVLEEQQEELRLYPNPVKDKLQIDGLKGNVSWEIYSITGQQVLSGAASDTQNNLDLAQLAAGTYVLKVHNQDGGSLQFKVVKL